ncbi:MAG: hypothetical protein ACLUKN_14360 [Bacilli bacterium]
MERCRFFDSVSSIAVAFAGIAIGVSIDYAVHILYRLDASDKITRNLVCKTSVFYAKPVAIVAWDNGGCVCHYVFFGQR